MRTNQPKPAQTCAIIILCGVLLMLPSALRAADPPKNFDAILSDLASGSFPKEKAAIDALAHSRDMRVIPFFEGYIKDEFSSYDGKIVLKGDPQGDKIPLLDPLDRKPIMTPTGPLVVSKKNLKDLDVGNRERRLVRDGLVLLRLSDPDRERRLMAVIRAGDNAAEANLPVLQELAKTETDKRIKDAVAESIALIEVSKGADDLIKSGKELENQKTRLAAVQRLGELDSARGLPKIKALAAADKDPAAASTYAQAIQKIERWQHVVDWTGYIFSGLSLGSVLVIIALGLSVIFGLMNVINMAHGELVMIGAYTTYVVSLAFQHWMPSAFDWYFVVAIPMSFIVTAIVGMIIEATVVRRLYGRPLETLLATYGVGLILVQIVRRQFGDNIGVNAPTWLQGGVEVAQDIVLPYARIFLLAYCAACICLVYFIINRTKLGLLLRATTQNRAMAQSLGVHTKRVDLYTFALGAGLAGLAGCALTPIAGVTPDMGSNYIVDAFLVVVTGGVGKLAGAIWAGFGMGAINKLLEPIFQAVWAKVLILLLVILFIQRKPSGLFPAKGRLEDA